jgi:hypothetical protein
MNKLRGRKNHRFRTAILHQLSIHAGASFATLDIRQFIAGCQPRSKRVGCVTTLPLAPLSTALQLEFALGDIVRNAVPGDAGSCVADGIEVPGFACDNQAEFNLPTGLVAISWDKDVVKRAYNSGCRLRNSTGSVGTGIPDSFA